MVTLATVDVVSSGDVLVTHWSDGKKLRFHAIWLRDNSPDPETHSVNNGQRLIALRDIPVDTRIDTATIVSDKVRMTFLPEDKSVEFDASWLRDHAYDKVGNQEAGWFSQEVTTWDATLDISSVTSTFGRVSDSKDALAAWLDKVRRFGFGRLTNGPVESGALLEVINWFGFVRQTNYGTWFEVKSEINPANLAYSNLGLQAHSDNPYRDPVPTLQLLYCLENNTDGGDSLVVDGFAAAQKLRQDSPEEFDLLARYCARFSYRGKGEVELNSRRPMIELAPDGELIGIRFNNRSADALTDIPYDVLPDYYRAYRHLGNIIDDPKMAVAFKLAPGGCFLVDNTRVLHGRTAFNEEGGTRWLQGCYADKDALDSTLAVLRDAV